MVDKVDNPTPEDKPRMTLDYSRVDELLPGAHMELSSKVHENSSDPRHKCNRGQHFDNAELREFLRTQGVTIKYSPSGASNSTGKVEMSNKLVEEVLRKDHSDSD